MASFLLEQSPPIFAAYLDLAHARLAPAIGTLACTSDGRSRSNICPHRYKEPELGEQHKRLESVRKSSRPFKMPSESNPDQAEATVFKRGGFLPIQRQEGNSSRAYLRWLLMRQSLRGASTGSS